MFRLTPILSFLLGIAQIGIGIGILFLPISIHVISWVLILFGSMFVFLAGYLWFNHMITKASEKVSNK